MKDTTNSIWTKPFLMALSNNFFVFLVFYSLLTVLPVYVIDELRGSEAQAGLVTTMFLLSAIIVRPFSGKIIDRLGKKKTLMISVFLFGASSFFYFLTSDFYLLMGLRFFHGIWFSFASTVLVAIAADMIPEHRKGEGMGYFAMSMNLAVVAGPFLSLALVQFIPFSALFLLLAGMMVIAFILTFGIQKAEAAAFLPKAAKRLTVKDLIEVRAIPIASVGFLTAFAYSGIMSFISVYAKSVGLFESVSLFFVVFAAAMLLSRPYTGRLFDHKGPDSVIYPSLFIFAAGLIILSVTHTTIILLLAGAMIGLGYGALLPSYQTMAIQSAARERTSHSTSTFFIFYDLGIAAGSVILGMISAGLGFTSLYLMSSVVVLVTIFIYKIVSGHSHNKQSRNAEVVEQ
ncbi:MFS transporter [Bacillus sp. Marseille-Q1617]|uniref:MFS transporter n=1 Tax=Bacillus sp. Marseille-Q1617 TaxID=2736887 RepID=UPI00158A02FA|nr:MFS transporter [Bacillus sp. Marseille-Q1617]